MIVGITQEVVKSILLEAPRSMDGLETGGILLGLDDRGAGTITVTAAGDPGRKAFRARRRFLRDLEHAQRLADLAYEADRSIWVGEWHTHTIQSPLPSPTDLATYFRLLADPKLEFDVLIAIVVTMAETGWFSPLLWPWVVTRGSVALTPFRVSGGAFADHD